MKEKIKELLYSADSKNIEIAVQLGYGTGWDIPLEYGFDKWLELGVFPSELFGKTLELCGRSLSRIPDEIGALVQLELLDLHNNRLTTLPESIGNLVQLKSVFLQVNNLSTLPETICQLTELQHLVVFANKLTKLPDSIGNLPHLKYLSLYRNKIKAIPDSFFRLKALESLYLGQNRLTEMPPFGQLFKLKTLYLENNQLFNTEASKLKKQELRALLPACNIRF